MILFIRLRQFHLLTEFIEFLYRLIQRLNQMNRNHRARHYTYDHQISQTQRFGVGLMKLMSRPHISSKKAFIGRTSMPPKQMPLQIPFHSGMNIRMDQTNVRQNRYKSTEQQIYRGRHNRNHHCHKRAPMHPGLLGPLHTSTHRPIERIQQYSIHCKHKRIRANIIWYTNHTMIYINEVLQCLRYIISIHQLRKHFLVANHPRWSCKMHIL